MTLIQIDPIGWIPDSLKRQIVDELVTFVADQAKKTLGSEVGQAVKRLRSDAAFQDAVDQGLKAATDRFVREYMEQDEDLVTAIARDPDFWKAESVRVALLEIIQQPGVYLGEERMTLARSFADVLRQRINRERVDRAVTFFLRCLAEELWTLPELHPIYALQFQRMTAEATRQQVELQKAQLQATTGLSADIRDALLQLTDTLAEQRLLAEPGAPPLPERPQVYHNLPQPDYGTFVGRQEELAQVHRILRPYPHSRHPLVTIDGIGGIGKSALALEAAHRYLRDYDRLPEEERFEAIIWTSAKSEVLTADGIAPRQQITRTLDDIYTAIAIALEREDITRARPEEQDELVTKALTRQRTLLIVDNLETVDDERVNGFLRELPAPTKAIVTTRHRIDVAYPIRLTGMPKEDALDLIAQECEKKDVTLTDAEAEKLYRRTGGVPLAVVWSVAQMGYGYGVESVLRRLGEPTGDIARFCFEDTVALIRDTVAHKLLIALSFFSTDASREALGIAAGLEEGVFSRDDGLVVLEKLSLVNKWQDRFWMLPLTKRFASKELQGEKEWMRNARERLVDYYNQVLKEYSGGTIPEDHTLISPEFHNIKSLIEWCQTRPGYHGTLLQLIDNFSHFLWSEGHWKIWQEHALIGLEVARDLKDHLSEGVFTHDLANLAFFKHDLGRAETLFRNAMNKFQQTDELRRYVISATRLSLVLQGQGHMERARSLIEETYPLAERLKDDDCIHRLNLCLAQYYFETHQPIKIIELLTEMVNEHPAEINSVWVCVSYRYLGRAFLTQGDLEKARNCFFSSLHIAKRASVKNDIAYAYECLAQVEYQSNNMLKAKNYATKAQEIFENLGMPDHLLRTQTLTRKISIE